MTSNTCTAMLLSRHSQAAAATDVLMPLCIVLQMDELEHKLKELEGTCSPIISKYICRARCSQL